MGGFRVRYLFTFEIAKELGRDHRTLKKLVISPAQCNGRSDNRKIRHRAMRQIKKDVRRNPLQTSKEVLKMPDARPGFIISFRKRSLIVRINFTIRERFQKFSKELFRWR